MPFVHLILDREASPDGGGKDEVVYPSLEAFRSAGIPATGFMVDTRDAQHAEAVVQALRTDPATYLLPLFLSRELGPRLAALCDGIPSGQQARDDRMQRLRHRMQKLAPEVERQDQDFRLLAYLYCRPETFLAPIED